MPTFRKDLHLGHEVPTTDTADLVDGAVTGDKIAQRVINWFHIIIKAIKNEHLDDGCVDSRALAADSVKSEHIAPGEVKAADIGDGEVKSRHIGDGEVKTVDIADGAVTAKKLDPSLLNEIRSAGDNGYRLATTFGNSDLIGVSQKALTAAFNAIWSKLEDITGEVYQGINMVVSPTYFVGDDGCTLNIYVDTVNANGVFEKIAFYWNDEEEPFVVREQTTGFTMSVELPERFYDASQVKIRCEAQTLGIDYLEQKMITRYDSLFLGAGQSYTDLMMDEEQFDPQYAIPATHHMRGAYNRTIGDGEHIILVAGDGLERGFIRADINGLEIAFEPAEEVTIGDNTYVVFVSENEFSAGEYNIDING